MSRYLSLFSIICFLCFSNQCSAQKNNVKVNTLTGAADVIIPVYQITRGQISLPINLIYSATGAKPKDVEGTAGMGWQLQCGGQIQRKVRGLPDDVMKDNGGHSRLGWMYNLKALKINSFYPANDNNPSTCQDDTSDVNYITNNFAYNADTEPDIFYVNAPGLSCELIFDQLSKQFKPINYQDIKIAYSAYSSTDTYAGVISSFTITNDKGVIYSFNAADLETQKTYGGPATYFANAYGQYQYGITFNSTWHLTSIIDNGGSGVSINYNAATPRFGTDAVSVYMPGATSATLQYKISTSVTPQVISQISGLYDIDNLSDMLTFNWVTNTNSSYGTGQTLISSITGAGRTMNFQYASPSYNTTQYTVYNRYFLQAYYESGCSSPVNYQFAYNGVDFTAGTTALPDSTSLKVDYWGYYANNSNTSLMPKVWISPATSAVPQYAIYESGTGGSSYPYYTTNGNSRAADPANVMTGSLSKITYAEGGSTTLSYESNDYLDVPSGIVVPGNGIRIKQIIDDDGFGTGNTVTRNYAYTLPNSTISSGEPLSLPAYAFNVPYNGSNTGNSLWNSSTVVSDNDLSQEDHTIMYSYVKESQTGAGSTLYQYYVPANYWNLLASPACGGCSGIVDYNATLNNIQQTVCTTNTGLVANNIWGYPFTSSENYDFERGLLQKVTYYNDAQAEVGETSYTYQRSFSPVSIAGLKWENNPFPNNTTGVRAFAKYVTNYNTSELVTQVVKKVFDSPTLAQAQTSTATYVYGATNHKLLTQQQITNSDNSVITTNYKYVKDFPATSSTNRNINALYNLQLLNMNLPVESYQQITRSGVTKTTAASFRYYLDYPIRSSGFFKYRPSAQYKFFSSGGVTDFTPSGISGTTLNTYGGYYNIANYSGYNSLGDLQTSDDAHQHVKGMVLDNISGQPCITITNAGAGEMFFDDFDSEIEAPWSVTKSGSSGYTAPAGSHNGNAAGLGTGQSFSCTIAKNALANNYIFSAWINSSTSGNISFVLTPSTGPAITSTQVLANTAGAWTYEEWKVPVGSMTSTFTLSVSADQSFGVDDIIFYPETAEVTTYAYDPVTHFKISETNTNGVSVYFTDDIWGRLIYTLDQDHNIIKKNTYVSPADLPLWNPAFSSTQPTVYKNIPVAFAVGGVDVCQSAGVIVHWDFGDGILTSSALNSPPQHIYNTTGSFTVRDTVYSSVFGKKVLSPLSVTVNPTPVYVTISNNTNYPNYVLTTTFSSPATGQTYTFSGTTTTTPVTVPPDTYTVQVYVSGGQLYNGTTGVGYSAVLLNGDCAYQCQDYTSNNRASFIGVNISTCTNVNISVNKVNCLTLSQ